jgi:hypothetical protein
VKVLSRLYRRLFLTRLRAAFDAGQLRFCGALASLDKPAIFTGYLRPLRTIPWVVYAKRAFGGVNRQIGDQLPVNPCPIGWLFTLLSMEHGQGERRITLLLSDRRQDGKRRTTAALRISSAR